MLKKNSIIFLISFFVVLLTSCGKVEDIEIREVKSFEFKGIASNTANFSADILIFNPNRYKIKIKEIDVKVLADNTYIGRMICNEEVIIPSNSETLLNIPCGIRIANIFSGASTLYRLTNKNNVKVELDGTVTAQVKMIKKKIKINRSMTVDPSKY